MDNIKKIINILITLIAIIMMFYFIAPFFLARILNIGNIAGIMICLLLIFKFGLTGTYNSLKEKMYAKKFTKILWKIYSICGIAFTIYAVLVSGLMIGVSLNSPKENSTVIVLGAKVNPNGPSAALWGRIMSAEYYLKDNNKAVAVVTGGQGDDEPMTEAQCMYDYLIGDGIEANRIYKEEKATNTYENIAFSYEIIKENNLDDNLVIATDSYHQLRARIIAYKQGLSTDIGSVNADTSLTMSKIIYPTYFLREWFAIPVELLK